MKIGMVYEVNRYFKLFNFKKFELLRPKTKFSTKNIANFFKNVHSKSDHLIQKIIQNSL